MSSDNGKERVDKNVVHLDEGKHLPVVPAASQGAEVVRQIIEQILANERRRARLEFVRLSSFFFVILVVMLASGIWFARQLLTQLREERHLMEKSWRLMAGGVEGMQTAELSARPPLPETAGTSAQYEQEAKERAFLAAQNREAVAKMEQNVKTMSGLLKDRSQDSLMEVRDMLQKQQSAIEALNTRLSETAPRDIGGDHPAVKDSKQTDFITVPVSEDLNLRMPIPSL